MKTGIKLGQAEFKIAAKNRSDLPKKYWDEGLLSLIVFRDVTDSGPRYDLDEARIFIDV